MSATMTKVAFLVESRRIEVDEKPVPKIGDDDALLRVERAGLCGTDYKLFTGTMGHSYPIHLGHEIDRALVRDLLRRPHCPDERARARDGQDIPDGVVLAVVGLAGRRTGDSHLHSPRSGERRLSRRRRGACPPGRPVGGDGLDRSAR